MTTIVIAPDSFKESMPAEQICTIMKNAILQVMPNAQCICVPMADGGEGTIDALVKAKSGLKIVCEVQGPLSHQNIVTHFGLVDHGQTAIIEMAKANGIHLLAADQRDPSQTSTYGTGQMIAAALELGVKKIIIGLGGSVTNDAGAGMASALGAKFLDKKAQTIAPKGGNLNQVHSIDLTGMDSRLGKTEVIIASDVNNPLYGQQGAAFVFAPQKGANPEMVAQLDQNLVAFADVVEGQLNLNLRDVAGAGAAGGLGFGLMVFLNANIQSGVELIIQETVLAEKIAQADLVFTGEGKIDFQTQFGKTPFGVAQIAKSLNKPVYAFAGRVDQGIEVLYELGFTQIMSINPPEQTLADSLKNAVFNLDEKVKYAIVKFLNNR